MKLQKSKKYKYIYIKKYFFDKPLNHKIICLYIYIRKK